MARSDGEHALGRLLAYLRWCGIEPTPELTRTALRAVDDALAGGNDDLIARVMAALPQQFDLPQSTLPPAAPPIRRASIGYR